MPLSNGLRTRHLNSTPKNILPHGATLVQVLQAPAVWR